MAERGADPSLAVQIAEELQRRVSGLPLVKVEGFVVASDRGAVYRVLRAEPGSLSEISRLVRAARTMKLHVRCVGAASSLNRSIFVDDYTVLVDLAHLSDSERIEPVAVRMKDLSYVEGVRVLAGVTVKELCQYQTQNQVCVPTNVEAEDRTVVGSIVSGSHGSITSAKCSLADYVLQIRIVDIHGDIQTYVDNSSVEFEDSPNTIKNIVSGLGMTGIVYDVILKHDVLKTVKVDYEFMKIENLYKNIKYLKERVNAAMSTQLIYVPFSSVDYDCTTLTADIDKWAYKRDEIMLRTINEVEVDSEMRQYISVIDEERGCVETILTQPDLTPIILKESHENMKRKFLRPHVQYLPWAIHCFPTISTGFHDVTITIPFNDMEEFVKTITIIFEKIEYFAHVDKSFPVNSGVRINFTSGSEVTLCPGKKIEITEKYAHIKILSVLSTQRWGDISYAIIDEILRVIPSAALQWSSEWIDRPIVVERVLELESENLNKMKGEIEKMDRDGVFLNIHLQRMFYPHMQSYRATYKQLQNEYLMNLG